MQPYPNPSSYPNPYPSPNPNPNPYLNPSSYPNPYPRPNPNPHPRPDPNSNLKLRPNPSPKPNPNPNPNLGPRINQNHSPNHILNPNLNHPVAQQFEPPILFVDSPIEQNVTPSMLEKGMNLETSPITTKHSPQEGVIQITREEQYFIGTCSKNVVETQNPIISLNHSCKFEKNIFDPELEGFIFFLSPGPLCLQGSEYEVVEDLHQLENPKYVDSIES